MNPTSLLNWMLLSTVLLGAWWLCYRVALRSERSFAYNRVFLVLGPLLAAALPLLPAGWLAGWGAVAALPGMASILLPTVQVSASGAAGTAGISWQFWVWAVYLSGVSFTLARLGVELGQLWLATRNLTREKRDGYTLVHTHGQLPTSSFGRTIFWDETLPLSPAEARQVLHHELAHAHQGHTYDRLLLELLRAALWFNPFVYLSGRALALTHEFLADEAALRTEAALAPAFSPSHSYSHLLARQVATRLGFSVPLAHSFSHSQTLRRIAMIHETSSIHRWKQWLALPLFGALVFTVACLQSPEALAQAAPASRGQLAPPPPPPPPPPKLFDMPPPPPPEKLYTYVENMPQLPGGGGNAAIVKYIQSKLAYPNVAAADRQAGRVFVSFYVDSKGQVQQAKIVKGLAPAYDAAVVAAVEQLPRFIPGTQNNKPVSVTFTVPIEFTR